jgi:hypothetical protein
MILRRWTLACLPAFSVSLGASTPALRPASVEAAERMVVFNIQTLKYHHPSCIWAHRCTRHCVLVPLSEALRRGGVPPKTAAALLKD